MSNLVIVAIPAKDDYIHKISSEKVPHMTLLFLGEDAKKVNNLDKILDFTKHAADQSLMRFGLEVDRRGVLGPNLADVLFFSKSKWSGFETVRDYRSYLLKDNSIRTAYDLASQFPEWDPHITLGYPETPAKPDERDYPGINYVTFDRIAVWFGDYEGIEFPLKTYDWNMDMAASGITTKKVVEDILSHHGIMGMKWGRRSGGNTSSTSNTGGQSRSERRAAKKVEKNQVKLTKKLNSSALKIEIHNASIEKAQKDLDHINAKPEYVKARANGTMKSGSPIEKKYHTEIMNSYIREVNKNLLAAGINRSGPVPMKAVATLDEKASLGFTVSLVAVKHDDTSNFKVKFIKDSNGVIIGFELVQDSMMQTSLIVEDILSHHGIMGMKWGRRSGSSGPVGVTVRDKGKKLKTSGGQGFPAHADAVRARKLGQIGKKSGVKALSNEQLKAYNERLNLEQNTKRLSYNDKNAGQKFVANLLGQTGKNQLQVATNDIAAHQVKKHITSRLIKVGASAAAA